MVVCPGPNLAYFTQIVSLADMVKHIYGNGSVLEIERPNVFVKELGLYVSYLKDQISKSTS